MKNKNKILSIVTLSVFGAMLCACNFESKTSDNSLFVRKTSGFNSIFYVGEPISYDGIKVVDSNNEEVSDYTFSIEEGTILGYESDKLTIEVSKPGYEKASFNVTVLREGYPYEGTIDIYSVNDFHGAFSYSKDDEQTGFSRIATYLLNKKEENPFTVIVSAGDMWQGGIESNKTKGKIVNEAMNIATFDAMTLGNHEFDWGEEVIKENASLAEFPFLGSNLTYSSNDERPSYLKGSTIDTQDESKLHVKAKSMSHEDLENEQHDVTTGFQIQTGFGERVLQGTTTFGLTDKETIRESTTRSTISKGQLEITEEPKEEINRNIELIEEIRRDEIISDTDFSITVDNRLFSGDGLRDIGRSIVNLPRNLGTMTRNVVSNPLTNEITSYINSLRNEELIILQSDTLLASNVNMPLPRVTDIETINQVRQLFEAAGIALLAGEILY